MMVGKEIEVWRAGVTASYMSQISEPGLRWRKGYPVGGLQYRDIGGFRIELDVPSKGGGTTTLYIWVPPEKYEALSLAMMEGGADAAEAAFLKQMLLRREKNAPRS